MELEPVTDPSPRQLIDDERASLERATRLRVLEEAGLLGDPLAVRATSLDRICELVVRSVDAPTAHVSIITPHDQRYAGGCNIMETLAASNAVDHDHSWCKYVAVDREPLVIADATTHPMTAGSPAIADFGARSYAGVPLVTSDGESIGALCAVDTEPHEWSDEDVDTLRRLAEWVVMEVELRRQVIELRQASQLKQDLVAMVSHELRNPLTTVVGSAAILDASWEDLEDDRRRQLVELMHRHGRRVGRLIEDLHTMVRIDADALPLELTDVPVHEVVTRAIEDALAANSVGRVDVPLDLVAHADRGRFEQVLVNLLTNALKYGAAPIEVDATRVGDEVRVHVRDSGAGVPEAFVPRLFEPFARDGATADTRPGSGLGLSIIRGFAQAMEGDVRYEPPAEGEAGASFVVALPAAG